MCNEFQRLQQLLAHAVSIAANAHSSQFDKGGYAYILHPLRLMLSVPSDNIKAQIVAVLHDVIEDTSITEDFLRNKGFDEDILLTLRLLTHNRTDQSYAAYIREIRRNELARIVKMADLRDNSDIDRLKGLREKDFERMNKYCYAYSFLNGQIKDIPDKW